MLVSGRTEGQSLEFLAEKDGITPAIRTKSTWPDPIATYDYQDADGKLLYRTVKFPKDHNPPFIQQTPNGADGWKSKLPKDVPRVLYRLPELNAADPSETVIITEGEKDAETARCLGFVATTTPLGAGKWPSLQSNYNIQAPLKDRICWIVPDNDEAGRKHALDIAISLSGFASVVKVVNLPGLPEKGDLSDFYVQHGPDEAKAMILELAEKTPEFKPGDAPKPKRKANKQSPEPRESAYDRMRRTVADLDLDAFVDTSGRPWYRYSIEGKTYIEQKESFLLRNYLKDAFRLNYPDRCPREVIEDVLEESLGCEPRRLEMAARVAEFDGAIYIDIADGEGRIVKCSKDGVDFITAPPESIIFRRISNALPLPAPDRTGRVHELAQFIPSDDTNTQTLLMVWIISVLLPQIERPGLWVYGPAHSGKSSLQRYLRGLCDPIREPNQQLPRSQDELVQCSFKSHILTYDNEEEISEAQLSTLCRIVTGMSFQKKKNYTDDEEINFHLRRTFILTARDITSYREDFLERCLLIKLPGRNTSDCLSRNDQDKRFDKAKARIFGAMLSILSTAMRTVGQYEAHTPRTRYVDWERWCCAIADAAGIGKDKFLEALESVMQIRHKEVVQNQPLCIAVESLADHMRSTTDSSIELPPYLLFTLLKQHAIHRQVEASRFFPKAANSMSRQLRKYQDDLKAEKISIGAGKSGNRYWTICVDGSQKELRTVRTVHELSTLMPA
jgi:hypothetical protein